MNENTEEIEERMDRFLQAEENESSPAFQDATLARDIIRDHQDGFPRVAGKLLPYVTLGLAACLALAFLPDFGPGDAAEESPTQDSIAVSLLDSDKELLEDLELVQRGESPTYARPKVDLSNSVWAAMPMMA